MYLQISSVLPNSYVTLAGWVSRNSIFLSTTIAASFKGFLGCMIPPALEITFLHSGSIMHCEHSKARAQLHREWAWTLEIKRVCRPATKMPPTDIAKLIAQCILYAPVWQCIFKVQKFPKDLQGLIISSYSYSTNTCAYKFTVIYR